MTLSSGLRAVIRHGLTQRVRTRWITALATCVATLSLTAALTPAIASAQTVPPGGDFQSIPTTWTAAGSAGLLSTISAAQASDGSNSFYRTSYDALVGLSTVGLDASETISSPTFTWSNPTPAAVTMTLDERAALGMLVGVGNGVELTATLLNHTTNTSTDLLNTPLTTSSNTFATLTATVNPAVLIAGDSYTLSVTEAVDPLVTVVGSATIDLDNVGLNVTQNAGPTLTSGSPAITNVTSSGATATAIIDPGTSLTTVTVNYGTTTGYGQQVTQTIPAFAGPTTVSVPITGLSGSTAYDADIVAMNASGTVSSANLPFTTLPMIGTPPTVGPASVVGTPGERTTTIADTVNAGGVGGQGATYFVQYGTVGSGYGSSTSPQTIAVGVTGAQPVTVAISGLTPGTAYHARVVANGPGGTTTGTAVTFTTAAASPPTLTTPSYASIAANGTEESVALTVNPGANDTQVSVSYGPTNTYGTTVSSQPVPAGSGPTSVAIPLTGLIPGQTYHAAVTVSNVDGTLSSTDAQFIPMSTVQNSSGTANPYAPGETLQANADVDGQAASYYVQYGPSIQYGTNSATQLIAVGSSGLQPLSVTLSGLAPSTSYHAQLVLIIGAGTAYGSDIPFTTGAAQTTTTTTTTTTTSTTPTVPTTTTSSTIPTTPSTPTTPTTPPVPAPTTPTTPTNTTSTTITSAGGGGGSTGTGGGSGGGHSKSGAGASCIAGYVSGSRHTLSLLKVPAGAQVTAGHPLKITIAHATKLAHAATYRVGAGKTAKSATGLIKVTLTQLRVGRTTKVRFVLQRRHAAHPLKLTLAIHALACGTQLTATRPSASVVALSLRSPKAIRKATFTMPRGWQAPRQLAVITATGTSTRQLSATASGIRATGPAGGPKLSRRGLAITVGHLPSTTTGLTLRFPSGHTGGTVVVHVLRAGGAAQTVRATVKAS